MENRETESGDGEGKAAIKWCFFQASHLCWQLKLKTVGKHHAPRKLGVYNWRRAAPQGVNSMALGPAIRQRGRFQEPAKALRQVNAGAGVGGQACVQAVARVTASGWGIAMAPYRPGEGWSPRMCVCPLLCGFVRLVTLVLRAVRMGLGIQRPWLTRGEVCGHVALPTAQGAHCPAVMSLPALPVHSWSALPDSKMLPQWFLTSFRVKLPGNGSPPPKLLLPEAWAEILLT